MISKRTGKQNRFLTPNSELVWCRHRSEEIILGGDNEEMKIRGVYVAVQL